VKQKDHGIRKWEVHKLPKKQPGKKGIKSPRVKKTPNRAEKKRWNTFERREVCCKQVTSRSKTWGKAARKREYGRGGAKRSRKKATHMKGKKVVRAEKKPLPIFHQPLQAERQQTPYS